MPKVPMDYSKTIFYKIVCKDVDIKECYVGQTTNFSKRKTQHKNNCINEHIKKYNIYVYKFIREHNGWENWSMIEIEKYNATDKFDAHKRERYWIETLESKLNKVIPTRTDKEYYEQNKEQIKEQKKEYYETNREQIIKHTKEYYNTNQEKILNYREANQEHIKDYQHQYSKIYREQNKEKYNLYCEQNKDKINAQRRLNRKLKKEQSNVISL